MARQFKTAAAFKAALEERLRKTATGNGVPFQTLQLKLAIERLLARLFHTPNPPWVLKGGFAMDLRFRPNARTTKDVDLSVPLVAASGSNIATHVREKLQEAVDADLGDYLTFRIGQPKRELTNAPGGGARFPCATILLGKIYARFHIDVGYGDAVIGQPETLVGDNTLSFAGIGPATVLAIPKAQQFAEKIHAYTFPWDDRTNTRTKDLVDLILLLERDPPNPAEIRDAVSMTFSTRKTHPLPEELEPPSESWKADFIPMALEAGLSTGDYLEAYERLKRYWETIQPM